MERLRGLKYALLLLLCLFITGVKACPSVNLFNNLQWGDGTPLTARIVCSSNTWEADTGEDSNCQLVFKRGELCDCDVYLDGDIYASTQGCDNIGDYCDGDATLLLTLDGSDIALYIVCVDKCGEDISGAGDFIGEAIIDLSPALENSQKTLDLYMDY